MHIIHPKCVSKILYLYYFIHYAIFEWKNRNANSNILDIGCEVGLIGHPIGRFHGSFNETFKLFGFDHSVNASKYVKQNIKNILNIVMKYFERYK